MRNLTRCFSTKAVEKVKQIHVPANSLPQPSDPHVLPFRKYKVPILKDKPSVPLCWLRYGKVKYIDTKKPPVLMLHGLFGSRHDLMTVGSRLTKNTLFPTYGIDLRNHGMSPHVNDHTYTSMANDVIRLLKEKQWEGKEKPILCGQLMGAKTAMMVALLEPDLISKLIIIDNAPVVQPLDEKYHQRLLGLCHLETNYRQLSRLEPKKQNKAIDKILHIYEQDEKVCQFLKTNVNKIKMNTERRTVVKLPVFNFRHDEVIDKLGDWPQEACDLKFEKPTLILKSDGLDFIHSQEQFTTNFPENIYKDYDCSNLVADLPKEFLAAVTQFITDVPETTTDTVLNQLEQLSDSKLSDQTLV